MTGCTRTDHTDRKDVKNKPEHVEEIQLYLWKCIACIPVVQPECTEQHTLKGDTNLARHIFHLARVKHILHVPTFFIGKAPRVTSVIRFWVSGDAGSKAPPKLKISVFQVWGASKRDLVISAVCIYIASAWAHEDDAFTLCDWLCLAQEQEV